MSTQFYCQKHFYFKLLNLICGPASDGNEKVLRIPQCFYITETSPSDCLVSYPGHSLWGSYLPAEKQLIYSTAPVNWSQAQSGATTLGQSGPVSNGNEGLLCFPQSFCITGTSLSDCLVSYPGHLLWGSYLPAEKQSMYSTTPVNWAMIKLWTCCGGLTSLQRSSRCILPPQSTGQW